MYKYLVIFYLTMGLSYQGLAKDLGTYGHTYKIAEQDLLKQIETKLQNMKASGELEAHNKKILSKTKSKIETPDSIKNITNTTEPRTFYYDPTYVVAKDIRDHLGRVIAKAGKRINPLDIVPLSQKLIFINATDKKQITWLTLKQLASHKIILIAGSPSAVLEELSFKEQKKRIYFDQLGSITKKLGIKHVPAIVEQDSKKLKIREVLIGRSENATS